MYTQNKSVIINLQRFHNLIFTPFIHLSFKKKKKKTFRLNVYNRLKDHSTKITGILLYLILVGLQAFIK